MFTSLSFYVPTETKNLILAKIREMRPLLSAEIHTDWWEEGSRYHSDEQCFQGAMQKALPLTTPALDNMSDSDMGILVVQKLADFSIEDLARIGLQAAASCDYYYTYEKSYV